MVLCALTLWSECRYALTYIITIVVYIFALFRGHGQTMSDGESRGGVDYTGMWISQGLLKKGLLDLSGLKGSRDLSGLCSCSGGRRAKTTPRTLLCTTVGGTN